VLERPFSGAVADPLFGLDRIAGADITAIADSVRVTLIAGVRE
jgi:hypothetical protein